MTITVKRATEGDIDFIASLEEKCFSLPESRESLLEMTDTDGKLLLTAYCDGEAAGYIGAYTVCRESDIMTVAVSEKFRGNGIGKKLLCTLEEELMGNSDVIFLEVRESNHAARRLYTSHGFSEIGVRKNYYQKPTENAILYKKDL